jgi:hypothetical protein
MHKNQEKVKKSDNIAMFCILSKKFAVYYICDKIIIRNQSDFGG